MIIKEGHDIFSQHGDECAFCGDAVLYYPFVSWDFLDNGAIARVAFHPECAQKLMLRMSRDLYEIDTVH